MPFRLLWATSTILREDGSLVMRDYFVWQIGVDAAVYKFLQSAGFANRQPTGGFSKRLRLSRLRRGDLAATEMLMPPIRPPWFVARRCASPRRGRLIAHFVRPTASVSARSRS